MAARTRRELSRDIAAGIAALVIAALYWLGAESIRESALIGSGIGADALPKAFALTLGALAIVLLVQSLLAWRRAAPGVPAEPRAAGRRAHLRAAGMLAIGAGFIVLLETIGYFLSVVLLLVATALYNGQALSRRLVLVAAGLAVVFYLLFVRLLGIPLPPGVWPRLWGSLGG